MFRRFVYIMSIRLKLAKSDVPRRIQPVIGRRNIPSCTICTSRSPRAQCNLYVLSKHVYRFAEVCKFVHGTEAVLGFGAVVNAKPFVSAIAHNHLIGIASATRRASLGYVYIDDERGRRTQYVGQIG